MSPKKSTRTGCSSVGGKTSTMPPRTANSPRRSTRSTRTYAAPTRAAARSPRSKSSPDGQPDRHQVAEALDLRLQHAADRGHDHPRRRQLVVAGQPAEHGEPAADGVRARAEPLVRQGLPGRVVGDVLRRQQALQGGRQLLGLPVGRGDQQHRPVGAAPLRGGGHRGGDQRTHRGRRGQVERRSGRARARRQGWSETVGSVQKRSTSPERVTEPRYRLSVNGRPTPLAGFGTVSVPESPPAGPPAARRPSLVVACLPWTC